MQTDSNPPEVNSPIQRADIGHIIQVKLNEQERKILQSFTASTFFNDINQYFNQILLDGTINSNDAHKIDEFITDWIVNNEETALPKPLQFIQTAIIPKILGNIAGDSINYANPSGSRYNQYNEPLQSVVDEDNLPTYLPKIHDVIEREVRRRVKEEMKEHLDLKKRYEELLKKMEEISKLFSIKN